MRRRNSHEANGTATTRIPTLQPAATAEVHIVNGAPNPSELTIHEDDTVTIVRFSAILERPDQISERLSPGAPAQN